MQLEVHRNQESGLNRTQIETVESKRNEYRLVGSMRRRPGLTLFQFNPSDSELKEVELNQKVSIGFNGKPRFHSEAKILSAETIFFWALNRKNALKKLGLVTA